MVCSRKRAQLVYFFSFLSGNQKTVEPAVNVQYEQDRRDPGQSGGEGSLSTRLIATKNKCEHRTRVNGHIRKVALLGQIGLSAIPYLYGHSTHIKDHLVVT